MRYTECEVAMYFEDWDKVLSDCETQYSVDAVCFSDCGVADVVDPNSEVRHG
jgi:hypothetical protein